MPQRVILLSGSVGSGKTTVAESLAARFKVHVLKTRQFLVARGGIAERGALQEYGEHLDKLTQGAWVRDDLIKVAAGLPDDAIIVVDAVRILDQVDAIRRAFGQRVFHLHLTAQLSTLEKRYKRRPKSEIKELPNYAAVQQNLTEKNVPLLKDSADVAVDTDRCTVTDVVIRVASHIGLFGRECLRLVDVIVGGQYGSEGKGQIAAYLAPEYDMLVRVGGPNAGHKVWEFPKPYAFHQLPSGTRRSEARLLIGAGAVINVETLLREIAECSVDHERLSIDPQAMIISQADRNREGVLVKSIGSTGQGVGAATARRIMGRHGSARVQLAKDIPALAPFIRVGREVLEDAFHKRWRVQLEGTQGTGLSLFHGSYPHVTSRDTTVPGCLAEAGISASRVQRIIMVCRTYPIRVQSPKDGTSGFMSQPLNWSEISRRSGIPLRQLLKTERTTTTKRKRRVAEFDWALLRTAATLNAPTDIALTFTDYIRMENAQAKRFEQLTPETIRFVEEIEHVAGAPVTLLSTGFNSRSVIDRRMW